MIKTFCQSGYTITQYTIINDLIIKRYNYNALLLCSLLTFPRAIYGSIHAIQNFRCMILPWFPSFQYIFFAFQGFHGWVGIQVQSRQGAFQKEHFWSLWVSYVNNFKRQKISMILFFYLYRSIYAFVTLGLIY